jgi:hypothetical protein
MIKRQTMTKRTDNEKKQTMTNRQTMKKDKQSPKNKQ